MKNQDSNPVSPALGVTFLANTIHHSVSPEITGPINKTLVKHDICLQ